MKSIRTLGGLFAIVVLAATAPGRAAGSGAGTVPEVRRDTTPLDRSNQPVVTSYADVLEPVRRAVVSVSSSKLLPESESTPLDDPFWRRFFGPGTDHAPERLQQGIGSGVIISADGYILTNSHVVEDADDIKVTLTDAREIPARLVGSDPPTDVAVLKIDDTGLPTATLADSDQIRVGDLVFAVGNPLGIGQTTTMGIVSATGRTDLGLINQGYEDFIQTDASINPGNSGGALVDARGRVIGINTAILSTGRGNIGIGFAIPINLAAQIMRSLIENGAVSRGFLGVSLRELDAETARQVQLDPPRGVLIAHVQPDSPAAEAGLQTADVILAIDGEPVHNVTGIRLTIARRPPGTRVAVTVWREGGERTLSAVLARFQPVGLTTEILEGIQVAPVTDELRQRYELPADAEGVVVTSVGADAPNGDLLPEGTLVIEINRKPAKDALTARQAFKRGANLLFVNNRGTYRYLTIRLRE